MNESSPDMQLQLRCTPQASVPSSLVSDKQMLFIYYLTGNSQSQNSGSLSAGKDTDCVWSCVSSPFPSQPLRRTHTAQMLASLSAGHSEVHGPLSQAVRPPQGGPERHAACSLELCDAQGCTGLPYTFFSSPLSLAPLPKSTFLLPI